MPKALTPEERAAIGTQLAQLVPPAVFAALEERAESHRQAALEQLAVADPHDPATIAGLQVEVIKVDAAMSWLVEIFTDAKMAVDELQQQDFSD